MLCQSYRAFLLPSNHLFPLVPHSPQPLSHIPVALGPGKTE